MWLLVQKMRLNDLLPVLRDKSFKEVCFVSLEVKCVSVVPQFFITFAVRNNLVVDHLSNYKVRVILLDEGLLVLGYLSEWNGLPVCEIAHDNWYARICICNAIFLFLWNDLVQFLNNVAHYLLLGGSLCADIGFLINPFCIPENKTIDFLFANPALFTHISD